MPCRVLLVGLGAVAFVAMGPALGQSIQPPQPAPTEAAGFPVGPLTVYPGIDLAVGHDDNLFLQPGGGNVRSSNVTIVSPYVRAEIKNGPHKFDFGLRLDDGRYTDSPADSYTDYSLLGRGDLAISGRTNLKFRAEWRHGHDPRGSTDRAVSATPDEYDHGSIDGIFSYGAPGARGRIEIDGSVASRSYTNNRATTIASDRDTQQLGGTFFWRVMPRTELLAQYRRSNIDYSLSTSTQDSVEDRFYLGVKWEATAATTGYAKFGQLKKSFDSSARRDVSESSWDVGLRWSPLSYSVFDLATSKQANESTGFGDAIVTSLYSATWSHAWSSRVRTQVLASFKHDEFTNAASPRTDDTSSFGLRASYDFRRWLRFGAEYTYWNRDSNISTFDYKRNLFMLTVGANL